MGSESSTCLHKKRDEILNPILFILHSCKKLTKVVTAIIGFLY